MLTGFSSLLTQPQLLAIGGGLLAGAVAGTTLVVAGILPPRPAPQLTLLECPDAGREVARIDSGVSILITGRNQDGSWLELYVGVPGVDRGWAPASALRAGTAIDALPVVPCVVAPTATLGPPEPTPAPSEAPSPEATAVATVQPTVSPGPSQSPSPKPTKTPAPTPTAPVAPSPTPLPPPPTQDLSPPIVSNLAITSPSLVGGWYRIYGGQCLPGKATIQATASDPGGGVASVTLWYKPGTLAAVPVAMQPIGGGVWQYELFVSNTWNDLIEIGLWAQAQDTNGNLSPFRYFGDPNNISDISLVKDFCIS